MSDKTYLEHHGIKGQKWGVRRFQNPDGSYTNAGRSRYGIAKKELKNRLYSEYDKHENWHEKAITAHNKKYGQYQNNHDGSNRKLKGSEKKAYDAGVNKLWSDYESRMNNSRAKYKSDLKELKKSRNEAFAKDAKQALKTHAKKQLATSEKYGKQHHTAAIVLRQSGKTVVQGMAAGIVMAPLVALTGPAAPVVALGSAVGTAIAANNTAKAVTSIGYRHDIIKKG